MPSSSLYLLAVPVAVGIAAGLFLAYQYDGYGQNGAGPGDSLRNPGSGQGPGPSAALAGQMQLVQGGPPLVASSLVAGGSPVLGDPDAPITIVEWGDYQCTYCHLFHKGTLNDTISKYIDAGVVRLVFRDFALNGQDSVLAAEASHCAADQSKYWEYHDTLYQNWGGERTGWVTRESLGSYAERTGLDMSEFEECMDTQKHRQRVIGLYESGQAVGINATPSFLIFDDTFAIRIIGNQPSPVFVDAIGLLWRGGAAGGGEVGREQLQTPVPESG